MILEQEWEKEDPVAIAAMVKDLVVKAAGDQPGQAAATASLAIMVCRTMIEKPDAEKFINVLEAVEDTIDCAKRHRHSPPQYLKPPYATNFDLPCDDLHSWLAKNHGGNHGGT